MSAVVLPALDGREPLGFLAALGVLRVLADEGGVPARLSFSDRDATAVVHSDLADVDEIAGELRKVVASIGEGAVLPGVGAGFPPAAGVGQDPLRWPRETYRDHAVRLRESHPRAAEVWLPALTTDLAVDSQGRGAISPFIAPAGQQKLRTFFEKPLKAVRADPTHLRDALVRWRRVEGFTGEYLDHRVLRSSADDPRGRRGMEAGVPGATWLATMAIPMFRLGGDGRRVRSTLWQRTADDHVMIWPLWTPRLDVEAVRCLLEHPALRPVDEGPTMTATAWEPLGVFGVYSAHRRRLPGRTFEGVLSPNTVTIR
ncbi:type I-G CRISPR-associated protein, Cas3-extension family [Sinosporangium siamense]|uniref:Uncharacterized protein n=1 Tax=Sinosporangium siamense TaxID=1367973 RepID=A0A919RNC1_9ACTN|nr:hypothetical protein [Sinosporangium siamense]GII96342.1 hypothetical protein Ssi02_65730 [Sinosporangium siamense]